MSLTVGQLLCFFECFFVCFVLFKWVYTYACVCVSSVLCTDSETSAVRSFGDTWLRWKGQRVEYCRCTLRGQELCHIVPVISECDMDVNFIFSSLFVLFYCFH